MIREIPMLFNGDERAELEQAEYDLKKLAGLI